jgi:hypothetical protein
MVMALSPPCRRNRGAGRKRRTLQHRLEGLDGRYLDALEQRRKIIQTYDTLAEPGLGVIPSSSKTVGTAGLCGDQLNILQREVNHA